jgi:putative hemolysin
VILFLIVFLLLLIFISGFFSASETALFSLSSMQVKIFKQQHDRKKVLIATLLSNPRDLLISIIIVNIAVNILVQNVVSSLFEGSSGWAINVGVPLALTLIFGEVIPKSIGLANNRAIAIKVAPWLERVQRVLFPIRYLLTNITNFIARLLFFFLRKDKEISTDELKNALTYSRTSEVLNEDEAELVRGFLDLEDATVKQLMRPRDEVLFFDIDEPLAELISLFVDRECSRVPVCKGSLDQILGVMTARLFFLHRPTIKNSSDLSPFLQKPFYVPEASGAKNLVRQMYEKRISFAIVVDEYGSVSGLISLEDLVETVVGEIIDRRDTKSRYTRSSDEVIIASGKLELSEFEEIFNVSLESKAQMVTLGGWLTEQLGDIPKTGARVVTKDFLFQVLAADPNRVRRVYIRRLKKT